MTVVVAPIFGPILGGWITDNFSWPWIFYINLPVGMLAGIITWTLLHKRETKTVKAPIDVIGLLLLVAGVGCLQFMLDNGNDHDWFSSPLIVTLGIIALVCLTFLVVWEIHAKHPVVDLTLFKQRNFTVGVISLSLGMFAFFGINVVFPLWLQTTLGYTATWAGLASAPVGVLAFLLSPILGRNMQQARPAHGGDLCLHGVRDHVVLVLHLRQCGLLRHAGGAALRDGYGDPLLLHPAQPDLSVRPARLGDCQRLGPVQLLPHAGLQRLHGGDRDALAAPGHLSPRHAD